MRSKVDNGYYGSLSEAIRDMVRKQRELEQQSLLAALAVAEKAVDQGQLSDYSQKLFDEAVRKGFDRIKTQKPE